MNLTTHYLVFISSLTILFIVCKPVLIFLIPGILLLFLPQFKNLSFFNLISYISMLSMSYWIISFWLFQYFNIKLTHFFYFSLISFIFFILLLFYSKYKFNIFYFYKEDFLPSFLFI